MGHSLNFYMTWAPTPEKALQHVECAIADAWNNDYTPVSAISAAGQHHIFDNDPWFPSWNTQLTNWSQVRQFILYSLSDIRSYKSSPLEDLDFKINDALTQGVHSLFNEALGHYFLQMHEAGEAQDAIRLLEVLPLTHVEIRSWDADCGYSLSLVPDPAPADEAWEKQYGGLQTAEVLGMMPDTWQWMILIDVRV